MSLSQTHPAPERRQPLTTAVPDNRVFTVLAGGERFGMPVACVQTVFRIDSMTPVPLAAKAIVGLINLRGRIVTAVSLRSRLGMESSPFKEMLAIGIEHNGEAVALVVDEAGDVINLPENGFIPTPRHMSAARARLVQSVYRLDTGMISILDMPAVFDLGRNALAAA